MNLVVIRCKRRLCAVLPLLVLVSACRPASDGTAELEQPVLEVEPSVLIGELAGDGEYLFGDIWSVAVDDMGVIYVGDRIGASVSAFSPSGEFLGFVAREGEGPGEVSGWPADLTFDPEGVLHIRDASRVTRFSRSQGALFADSLVDVWRSPGFGNLSPVRSRALADGVYFYPDGRYPIGSEPRFFFWILRDGSVTPDTITVPHYDGLGAHRSAFYQISPGSGRMVPGLNRVPFAPRPSWDVTYNGTLLSTGGQEDVLFETDGYGDTLRVLRVGPGAPRPVPRAEAAESLTALGLRIDTLPVPLDAMLNLGPGVADRRLPEVLPSVLSTNVSLADLVWIERWPLPGASGSRRYDVFDSAGERVASLSLNAPMLAEPPPYFGRSSVVGIVEDEETGFQRVVAFFLEGVLPAPGS